MGTLPKSNSNIPPFVLLVTIFGRSALEKSGRTDRRTFYSLPNQRFEATGGDPPDNLDKVDGWIFSVEST
jgi:hypothetical protein